MRAVFLLLRGISIPGALRTTASLAFKTLPAVDYLRHAEAVAGRPTAEGVEELGQSCPLDKALPAVFAILLRHGDDLETALIENAMAGGDSAARGLVLGMMLGAAHGQRAIPARWIESLAARPRIGSFLRTVGIGESFTVRLTDLAPGRANQAS